jgi:hypothetical protein
MNWLELNMLLNKQHMAKHNSTMYYICYKCNLKLKFLHKLTIGGPMTPDFWWPNMFNVKTAPWFVDATARYLLITRTGKYEKWRPILHSSQHPKTVPCVICLESTLSKRTGGIRRESNAFLIGKKLLYIMRQFPPRRNFPSENQADFFVLSNLKYFHLSVSVKPFPNPFFDLLFS